MEVPELTVIVIELLLRECVAGYPFVVTQMFLHTPHLHSGVAQQLGLRQIVNRLGHTTLVSKIFDHGALLQGQRPHGGVTKADVEYIFGAILESNDADAMSLRSVNDGVAIVLWLADAGQCHLSGVAEAAQKLKGKAVE